MEFINDPFFRWTEKTSSLSSLYYRGDKSFAENLQAAVEKADDPSSTAINFLQKIDDFSSGVIETEKFFLAWVDHIRSWPLFYTYSENDFYISQNAYEIKNRLKNPSYNNKNLLEFKMSGYVTDNQTLINDIYSLNPGELLVFDKGNSKLSRHKYFSYIPTFDSTLSKETVIQKLDQLFDKLTKKIIQRANNKTIWIPLSGGFDSRILLCKLHEHGYKNIRTFTYGPRFNFEGFIAKKIARKLNIPWQFVCVPKTKAKEYFNSPERLKFWEFAMNLKTIPCTREYSALRYMHEASEIEEGSIFLNGQSGDYITGGHLSSLSKDKDSYDKNDYYNIIIEKHYDLWKHLKTPENIDVIQDKINHVIKNVTGKDTIIKNKLDGAIHEEVWEYEARQICYVANGQRDYEFFGYNWEMPLWEKSFVDFFQPLPFDMKYNQKIYKDYLRSYNYMGLFPEKEPYIWRWPVLMLWVVPFAQIIGILGGRSKKDSFYAYMRYWGHYANQYNYFQYNYYKKHFNLSRNVISLYVKKWFSENNLRF